MEAKSVFLKPAQCALDLGVGSERALYVSQDYILRKLGKIHRGISLMYTYYPKDESWPVRARLACPQKSPSGAWDYPYEDYFPYLGGALGRTDDEPFNFMKEIRQRGQDVVLTITIDPFLTEEDLIPIAKDLLPYGRVLLRINHECTGNWFCYTKRATYQQIADFYVLACKVMHEHAPNVKMILCAGMYQNETGKIEMEDIFLEAFKVTDYWSFDQYLALHWGWPVDIAQKGGDTFACYDVDEVYERSKKTVERLKMLTGMDKPVLMSELNADGDVTGPYEQANMMRHFMELLEQDKEKWLSGFTLYQFRDDGRLGLEITDPNNSDVGIEQPILNVYKKQIQKPFFSQKIESGKEISLPCKLRWGSSEDAEGVELSVKIEKDPHYFELYFDEQLLDANLMFEFEGYWFYKAPGVKCIDLMSYFFENPFEKSKEYKLRIFAPPATGKNSTESEDLINNYYFELKGLPQIRVETEPVSIIKKY